MVLHSYVLFFSINAGCCGCFAKGQIKAQARSLASGSLGGWQLAAQDLTGQAQVRPIGINREQESGYEPGAGSRDHGQCDDADRRQEQRINGKLETENSVFQVYVRGNGHDQNNKQQNGNDRVPKAGHVTQGSHGMSVSHADGIST
jgi:hypothetical protein